MSTITPPSKRARRDDDGSSAEEDEDDDKFDERYEELDELVYLHSSLESPENESRNARDAPGGTVHPRYLTHHRHDWVCAKDRRTKSIIDHGGQCEHPNLCNHYPLPDKHVDAVLGNRSDSDTELPYWKKRRLAQEEEDALRSEHVTVKDAVEVPPPPSQPAENDPVTAIIIHRYGGYAVRDNRIEEDDIIGISFEYSNVQRLYPELVARELHPAADQST